MTRAPFQVFVLPYRILPDGNVSYALLKREPDTGGYWHGIAGGGEGYETPLEAARREAAEEAGLSPELEYFRLDSFAMIPVEEVCGFLWGEDVMVIPNYSFAVEVSGEELVLSDEHTEYRWVSYDEARRMLHWEDNRNALWELNHRLTRRQRPRPT